MTQVLTLQTEMENAAALVDNTNDQLGWFEQVILPCFADEWQDAILDALMQIQANMQAVYALVQAQEIAKSEAEGQRDMAIFDADYYRQNAVHVVAGSMGEKLGIGHQDAVRALEAVTGNGNLYASGYALHELKNAFRQLAIELFEEQIFVSAESEDAEYLD